MNNPGDFVLTLMNARTAAHVQHLQVSGPGAYAKHVALQGFYEGIVPLIDAFAEAYQGCYGLIRFTGSSFKLEKDPVAMMTGLKSMMTKARAECDEPSLQNIIDEMVALTASTTYKLKHLA
jgi:Family of unknown function (DUF5856)